MESLEEKRTIQQNKALWLYFEHLAETLNLAGLDMKLVLKPSVQISWTKQNVHDYLWTPFQKSLIGEVSTTKIKKKKDIDLIYDNLNRHLGEKFGISESFPSIEEIIRKQKCIKN